MEDLEKKLYNVSIVSATDNSITLEYQGSYYEVVAKKVKYSDVEKKALERFVQNCESFENYIESIKRNNKTETSGGTRNINKEKLL